MKKLHIWGMSNQDTGVQLYRINQPLRFVAKQKLAVIHTLPFFGQHAGHLVSQEFREYQALEGRWADVLFTTVASDRNYLSLLLALKERYKLKLVIDLDDDILSTHLEPNNPAYKAYLNKEARYAEYTQACLREADLLIVSTDYLKKKYASLNENIVVIKNCIDPEFFKFESKPTQLTLGYAGSGSHQADWNMIEPVVNEMRNKYRAQVKILGPLHTTIADQQTRWVDMLQYPRALADMGLSLGLAPLKDSMMNRAKSNLRWLEYSAYKIPTIASDVVPFREMESVIRVSEPEEWGRAFVSLLGDPDRMAKLGEDAYNEMRSKYDPNDWSHKLFEAINKL